MAPAPLVRVTGLHGTRLTAWVHTPGGWQARVEWTELIGDSEAVHRATLDAGDIRPVDGEDYSRVPQVRVAQQRRGRVPTGQEWRRTG